MNRERQHLTISHLNYSNIVPLHGGGRERRWKILGRMVTVWMLGVMAGRRRRRSELAGSGADG